MALTQTPAIKLPVGYVMVEDSGYYYVEKEGEDGQGPGAYASGLTEAEAFDDFVKYCMEHMPGEDFIRMFDY